MGDRADGVAAREVSQLAFDFDVEPEVVADADGWVTFDDEWKQRFCARCGCWERAEPHVCDQLNRIR